MLRRPLVSMLSAVGVLVLFAGCAGDSEGGATDSAHRRGEATHPRELGGDESYSKVNLHELPFLFSAELKSLLVDADGKTLAVEGNVTELSLHGQPIELEVMAITRIGEKGEIQVPSGGEYPDIVKVGEYFAILTRDYGRVKVTFTSDARATLWLTPSQDAKFRMLVR